MKFTPTARQWVWRAALATLASTVIATATAAPTEILFVGNSYTFGRVDPVMSYNAANVHDMTADFYKANPAGANPWEPHPWGGIAGIFKQFTVQKGLDYDVSISTRNAASLRGHFLNTANAAWDLRGNIASQKWDVVVLQEQSDAALPVGMGKNANPAQFAAYANKIEQFIHNGAAQTYTETQLYGSLAACQGTGATAVTCNTVRNIPQNVNASSDTKVYLTETWARPDMVYAHLVTKADTTDPTGSPIPDGTGTSAKLYYDSLAGMTADLRTTIYGEAASNGHFAGVIGVGDAFQLAYEQGLVKTNGFYDANGVFAPNVDGVMNLWWDDYLHASKYGSYLDALTQFGTITGLDPRTLGAGEIAARDLGISAANALVLQQVAAQQLGMVPEPASIALIVFGLGLIAGTRARRNRLP
jgi:hypothetical protein